MRKSTAPTETFNFKGKWFHCIATTYGAWLYGDERGYRTRHHREHVEGDYKNPPPAVANVQKRMASMQSLKQPPAQIPKAWRKQVGTSIRDKLVQQGAFVLCLAASAQHVHVLVKLPLRSDPRKRMGLSRNHATFEAHKCGWKGRLWARRGKELPVKDRRHQLNVYRYILAHKAQGAWVWDCMDERKNEKTS